MVPVCRESVIAGCVSVPLGLWFQSVEREREGECNCCVFSFPLNGPSL